MRRCLECDAEYTNEAATCKECKLALVDEAQWEAARAAKERERAELRDVEMVRGFGVSGPAEAAHLLSELEREGIAAFLRSFQETAYAGLFVPQNGFGEIWVAKARLEDARRILDDLSKLTVAKD